MKLKTALTLALLGATLVVPLAASAAPVWRGDIHRFDRQDMHRWRAGNWRHGRHAGRLGWWWVVGGLWYFYPGPVYPYPDPYRPPVIVDSAPPVEVAPQAPAPAAPPVDATQSSPYWYYCEPSRTYYPYVATCPVPWKTVPATPAGVTP